MVISKLEFYREVDETAQKNMYNNYDLREEKEN